MLHGKSWFFAKWQYTLQITSFSPLSALILPSLLPTHSAPKPFLLPYAWATKVKGKINSLKGLQPHEWLPDKANQSVFFGLFSHEKRTGKFNVHVHVPWTAIKTTEIYTWAIYEKTGLKVLENGLWKWVKRALLMKTLLTVETLHTINYHVFNLLDLSSALYVALNPS